MALIDRREDMEPQELLEELELRFPEQMSSLENDYPDAWEALIEGDQDDCPAEEWDDLMDSIRSLLKV